MEQHGSPIGGGYQRLWPGPRSLRDLTVEEGSMHALVYAGKVMGWSPLFYFWPNHVTSKWKGILGYMFIPNKLPLGPRFPLLTFSFLIVGISMWNSINYASLVGNFLLAFTSDSRHIPFSVILLWGICELLPLLFHIFTVEWVLVWEFISLVLLPI